MEGERWKMRLRGAASGVNKLERSLSAAHAGIRLFFRGLVDLPAGASYSSLTNVSCGGWKRLLLGTLIFDNWVWE